MKIGDRVALSVAYYHRRGFNGIPHDILSRRGTITDVGSEPNVFHVTWDFPRLSMPYFANRLVLEDQVHLEVLP